MLLYYHLSTFSGLFRVQEESLRFETTYFSAAISLCVSARLDALEECLRFAGSSRFSDCSGVLEECLGFGDFLLF